MKSNSVYGTTAVRSLPIFLNCLCNAFQLKQMKLWMLAAILTCGLATTSCSDDDNDSPVQPADEIEEQLSQR